jgi:hypothetical protein
MTRFAPALIARPLVAAALLATATAVGLARLAPPAPTYRRPCAGGFAIVGPLGDDPGVPGSEWLDRDSGRMVSIPPIEGLRFQQATCSPWVDARGQFQAVGIFICRTGDTDSASIGLARISFPDGRLLDRVATELLPFGNPCWYPGTRARVLFASVDGQLYHHDFEPGDGRDASTPRPLLWRCPTPSGGEVRISEPFWPTEPRFERIVVASLQIKRFVGSRPVLSDRQPWWFRLSEDGGSIEEAGPLFEPGAVPPGMVVRTPVVAPTPGGGLALATYSGAESLDWDLRLTPLSFDDSGRPRPAAALGPTLAGRCRAVCPPAFSSDGGWVAAVQSDTRGRGTLLRLDLASRSPAPRPIPATPGPVRDGPFGKWSHIASAVRAFIDLFPPINRVEVVDAGPRRLCEGGE